VPDVHGERLKPQSRAVGVKGRTDLRVRGPADLEAVRVFDALELTDRETLIASRILREIRDRCTS
jgi:excinuclease UvrABC ATPase subunit